MRTGTHQRELSGSAPAARPPLAADLVLVLPAQPTAQRLARRHLRSWLDTLQWDPESVEDVLLAVTEAVTNVIDHAYPPDQPGDVHLHAWMSHGPAGESPATRRVTVTVVDRGSWLTPDRARAEAGRRGHGLNLMRRLSAQLHLQPSDAGTTVILVGPLLPA